MQEIGNNHVLSNNRLTIRVSRHSLSFSTIDATAENQVIFEPYIVKSGISIAANLREAFKTGKLLQREFQRVQVCLDTPTLMIPVEEFVEEQAGLLYQHTFTDNGNGMILHSILPDLSVAAVFAMNRDLRLVIDDHFRQVRIIPLIQPICSHLHRRSFTGMRHKLFAYFHDKRLEILSFQQHRLRFYNAFDAAHSRDAVYFILYVWKQLGFDALQDEIHLVGDMPDASWLTEALRHYVQKVYTINPSAEFNRAPVTQVKGMPFDLQTLFVRGR